MGIREGKIEAQKYHVDPRCPGCFTPGQVFGKGPVPHRGDCQGRVENLGIVCYYHRERFKRWKGQLSVWLRSRPRALKNLIRSTRTWLHSA